MLRDHPFASRKEMDQINEQIAEALRPPPEWRDPVTGLPAGWSGDEDEEWALFEQAMRG